MFFLTRPTPATSPGQPHTTSPGPSPPHPPPATSPGHPHATSPGHPHATSPGHPATSPGRRSPAPMSRSSPKLSSRATPTPCLLRETAGGRRRRCGPGPRSSVEFLRTKLHISNLDGGGTIKDVQDSLFSSAL